MFENSILSLLVWLPIIGGVLLLAIGNSKAALVRIVALLISIVTFLICIPLWTGFDINSAALQYEELTPWIS
ncbi:MAG: NADH-quinone oxidoreductase subunit M, partial [Proteobacteria bacterium]|nr:NADH-quinone oxidoreductase subunit M [Pseudomonadota bacterium]